MPLLIGLLRSPNEGVQEQAAIAIRNLSVDSENELKIMEEGGIPPLLALLRCFFFT